MYNQNKQYRCTIIRGKSQAEIDDMLPAYSNILNSICPCKTSDFAQAFNSLLSPYLRENSRKKKTLDNHRTEIAGKLFGMYYEDNGYMYISERTLKFLEDFDQPAFFKDVCFKFQFPNGMQKTNTIRQRIIDGISLKPYAFILKSLLIAKEISLSLTKKEIAYYILNSLDVLQGIATPKEVIDAIRKDKQKGIIRIINTEGKASSYDYQHINEQLNYLELANLIRIGTDGLVELNFREINTIHLFVNSLNIPLMFSFKDYDLSLDEDVQKMHVEWNLYYSQLSDEASNFATTLESLGITSATSGVESQEGVKESTITFGDEGENYVYNYEKERVAKVNKRLANKVLSLGKTKGLGYDIQSVIAEPGERMEFVKYIEVKSTRRVTPPNIQDSNWYDTINITRNEWVAAQQHKEFYSIYRVYFVRNDVIIHIMDNIEQKHNEGKISVVPITYRVDYDASSIDKVLGGVDNV